MCPYRASKSTCSFVFMGEVSSKARARQRELPLSVSHVWQSIIDVDEHAGITHGIGAFDLPHRSVARPVALETLPVVRKGKEANRATLSCPFFSVCALTKSSAGTVEVG